MKIQLQIVGLVRFSMLSPTFNTRRFSSLEDAIAQLFTTERMELRFRLFEQLCLPSLLRQSDKNFQLVILTSDQMPTRYLERLLALIDPHPQVICYAPSPIKHYNQIQNGYELAHLDGATHKALFRLDDDDGVDRDFIKRTRRLAEALIPVQETEEPFILCGNRGFYAIKSSDGVDVFDACEPSPLSTGATLVGKVERKFNPYRRNHRRYAQHYSVYSDLSTPSFIRTMHGDNLSSVARLGQTHQMSTREIRKQLKTHFKLSPEHLKDLLQ
ncbi:Putative rhamnosyl transferase [Epibacterium ulvae]|uniref:Putative rhamnosyl transferase n=1 Tax=Epibacterium ulvae TaxID=1156985 RepID=A0A1G5QTT6_9RHOB|nr:glycosyltransferase [Epibacterium ulvae]SCZ65263.1 Putative rhamnosyl transferase [Epibacterium ulvae]